MKAITIAVFNASTVVTDAEVVKIVAAIQRQVTEDFYPAWGIDATIAFVPRGEKQLVSDAWLLGVFDDSDQAGALGYHDITLDGLPLGKVFAASDIRSGTSLSVTMSHEILEMLTDPDINLCAENQGVFYAYENCDAVENDSLGYQIDGMLVSDFVYPAWFEAFRTIGPFDHQEHCSAPFQLKPGGYIGVYRIPGGWTQIYARTGRGREGPTYASRPRLGSRREKRRTLRSEWVRSVQ